MKNQRETALETFKAQSVKQDPISWHLWKRAFDEGVKYQKQLVKNNGVLDGVINCDCESGNYEKTYTNSGIVIYKCNVCGGCL